jgi:hypothetical protein
MVRRPRPSPTCKGIMHIQPIRTAVVIAAVLAAAGCRDATGGEPPPRLASPSITTSVLTSGGEGVLRGTNLDKVTGSITVDGAVVAPTMTSQVEIRFPMPAGRACEVDGRPVAIRAGTLSHEGRLVVPGVLALQVGESRVLTREEMASLCLQLPAGTERYVLTALNPGLEPSASADELFTVRSWTGPGEASLIHPARLPDLRPDLPVHAPAPRPAAAGAAAHHFSENPAPFDPRYATAGVGDTLPWVNWWGSHHPNCTGERDLLPTIDIVIAAVSASGKTVIAFDARSPRAAVWTRPSVGARLTRAAEMMERWAVAAVRETLDRGYQPLKGAGGRWFHIFRTDVPGWTVDSNDAPQTACRYSSEVPSTIGPDLPPEHDAQAEYLAGLAIHEYAHHAEIVYRIRRWGSYAPPARISTGWSGVAEAWAQTVQETAARLASSQPTAARYDLLATANSNVPFADFYLNAYGESPAQSLWSVTQEGRGGYYDQGTRLLMYLREKWGDAEVGSTGERFYERADALPHYDLPSLAQLVGMTASEALDQWSLADATDDLLDLSAAAARRLPQLQSWMPHDREPLPWVRLPRDVNAERTMRAGRGNYAALYLFGDAEDGGNGVSLTFERLGSISFVARITRLR